MIWPEKSNGSLQEYTLLTREGFLRKNIVAVSFFQNCAMHPYSQYISFPLNEIIQAWTSFLFTFIHVQLTYIVISTAQTD